MDRRQQLVALQKAVIDTTVASTALLSAERSRRFIKAIVEQDTLLGRTRLERRTSPSGVVDKMSVGARLIRRATENSDDGYRAGVGFAQVPYQTVKLRLPFEITEDVLQENIEGNAFEGDVMDSMTNQFSNDLADLGINGDTADVSADAPFLTINDGWLKQIATSPIAGRRIDGSAINGGALDKAHFFEALYALPNKYRSGGNLHWILSPSRAIQWWETLTDRAGAQGDQLLGGANGPARGPLNFPMLEVPAWPDERIVLADPRNFVQIVTWDVRRRKVTGETDAELAVKDKRLYIFFLKNDYVLEEKDAIVDVYGLDPV